MWIAPLICMVFLRIQYGYEPYLPDLLVNGLAEITFCYYM